MKRCQRLLVTGVFLSLSIVVPSLANALDFGVRGYLTQSALRGEVLSSAGGITGTELSLKDQLALGNVTYPSVEGFFGVGKHNFSLTYTQFDSSANTTLASAIRFKGITFGAGPLEVDMKLRMVDFEYQYDLLQVKAILAGFSLGLIGKLKYIEAETSLRSATLAAKESFNVPIPMVGVGASLGLLLNILEARAKLTGIGYGENLLYEAMADLSFTPFPFMDIHGGYRITGLKVNHNDYKLNTSFAGPYLALTIGF
ncbi:MAG: hypothetical protein U1C55_00590 [Smithellaceae bacterium]|nr:hypothetical protein [Smithellaceae bacterium]